MRLKLFYFKKQKKKDGVGAGREVGVVIKAQQEGRILVMMEMLDQGQDEEVALEDDLMD